MNFTGGQFEKLKRIRIYRKLRLRENSIRIMQQHGKYNRVGKNILHEQIRNAKHNEGEMKKRRRKRSMKL